MIITDIGLPLLTEIEDDLPETGFGADLEIDEEGNPSSVRITDEGGHNTAVTFESNGTRSIVSKDNRYRSSPQLEFVDNDIPVVAWTKAESWSNDPTERFTSLNVMTSTWNNEGRFQGNGTQVTSGTNFHPSLSSKEMMAALSFTNDLDGDPSTINDTEIYLTILVEGNWSEPVAVTQNNRYDDHSNLAFDRDGNLWLAWKSGDREVLIRTYDIMNKTWSVTREFDLLDSDGVVTGLSLTSMEDQDPILAISRMKDGNTYNVESVNLDSSETDLMGEAVLLHSTRGILSDLSINSYQSSAILSWIESEGDRSNILFAQASGWENNITWAGVLPLTDDRAIRFSQEVLPLEGGSALFYSSSYVHNGNQTVGGNDEIIVQDLSSAGKIEEVWYDLLGEYRRWESVNINADIRNAGLSREGRIFVNLDRISRDPENGNLSRVSLLSKLVQFDGRDDIETVTFTTTLVEHQLEYIVWTSSSWGDPAAYTSSSSIHLPVISDPRIVTSELMIDTEDPFNGTFLVSIRNFGLVTEDPLTVEILGHRTFGHIGRTDSFIPENATILNSTRDGLGPGIERVYAMNITLLPGSNSIWLRMKNHDEIQYLEGPFQANIYPDPGIIMTSDEILAGEGDEIDLEFRIRNNGAVTDFSGSNETAVLINYSLTDEFGNEIMEGYLNTSNPDPFSERNITLGIDLEGIQPGRYWLTMNIDFPSEIPFDPLKKDIIKRGITVIENISFEMKRKAEPEDFGFIGKAFIVRINNTSGRAIPVLRIVLYNGIPEDRVVISESFVTWIDPNGTGEAALPLGLDEGLYLLSIEGSTSNSVEVSVPWTSGHSESEIFEFVVKKVIIPQQQDDEIDMREVTDSALMGISAIALVLLLSVLFKRKDEDEKE
jgi:hypothetical protein